jgi:hypothetical protein
MKPNSVGAAPTRMPTETTDHSIHRKVLLAALGHERGAFDIDNPYQCYAFIWLQFECCVCGRTEFFDDANYPGLPWMLSAAHRARCDGWQLAPWSPDGVLDGRLRCPKCAGKECAQNAG